MTQPAGGDVGDVRYGMSFETERNIFLALSISVFNMLECIDSPSGMTVHGPMAAKLERTTTVDVVFCRVSNVCSSASVAG